MAYATQDTWNKFERWACRYKNTCNKIIEEIFDFERSYFDDGLFLKEWFELDQATIFDLNLTKDELFQRVSNKINFLRAYLVDISFDGPEFMTNQSNFLSRQYASRCDNSMGVWLEQDPRHSAEAGGGFGFQEFHANFFCENIEDADFASMRNILPFDRMFVRLPKAKNWDISSANFLIEKIKNDLEFDYSAAIQIDGDELGALLSLNFNWN
jgi:hypothetical protein